MNDLEKAIQAIDLKFKSGNDVKIMRAWVRLSEWEALLAAIKEQADILAAKERFG